MRTLSLALRNLLRNRRRSMATIVAMAIGSMAILLFGGYRANIDYTMQTAYVRAGGHLQVQHRDFYLYGSGNPTAFGIADYARIVDAIKADPVLRDMVSVVTPTLQFGGIAGNYAAGVSRTVIGSGLVAADHSVMRAWNEYHVPVDAPAFRLDNSGRNAAIVGVGLARVLQLCAPLQITNCPQPQKDVVDGGAALPDDIAQLSAREAKAAAPKAGAAAGRQDRSIELLASSARGTPNVAGLDVIHAESQGFKELDEVFIVLHLAQAQRLVYGSAQPKATSILIQLKSGKSMSAAQARVDSQLGRWSGGQPLAVRDFGALNPFYVQSVQMFDTLFGFIFVLIGGIVLFTVSNTMNTAVVERTVEIGTLRAIGLRQSGVRRLIVVEGTLLGLAGAVLGAVVAVTAAGLVNQMGLKWLLPAAAEPLPLVLNVWGESGMIIGTTVGLIVIATLSAWWPAYRAARLNVVDALRHT
ncbi:ABC transporter permease [Ideonella sp. A 288]|uniref:ABC transporter permease n=1 Tax=Ideonella sp. A 288 TaxID=1962181 RepID=UPI000B4B3204|nr:FtsX-like permease family protein [Ideonella sp. A 288]